MKSTLLAFAITLTAMFGFVGSSLAQSGGTSFVVSNQQSEALGEVTVTAPSGNYYVTVSGMATDTVTMSDTAATSITINNQTVQQGVKAIVTLPGGKQIAVIWPAQNEILVIDPAQL